MKKKTSWTATSSGTEEIWGQLCSIQMAAEKWGSPRDNVYKQKPCSGTQRSTVRSWGTGDSGKPGQSGRKKEKMNFNSLVKRTVSQSSKQNKQSTKTIQPPALWHFPLRLPNQTRLRNIYVQDSKPVRFDIPSGAWTKKVKQATWKKASINYRVWWKCRISHNRINLKEINSIKCGNVTRTSLTIERLIVPGVTPRHNWGYYSLWKYPYWLAGKKVSFLPSIRTSLSLTSRRII